MSANILQVISQVGKRKRAIVRPTQLQKEQLLELGFSGFDTDEETERFVFAFLPDGWTFVRTEHKGPENMGVVVEFRDRQGRCRVRQVEHLQLFKYRDTLEIVPIN